MYALFEGDKQIGNPFATEKEVWEAALIEGLVTDVPVADEEGGFQRGITSNTSPTVNRCPILHPVVRSFALRLEGTVICSASYISSHKGDNHEC
jgi:hypothetical protein